MVKFDFRAELSKSAPLLAKGAKIYIFGCGDNYETICKQYSRLVHVNIDDYVDGFIDNDKSKQGTLFHGKKVYSIDEIDANNSVVLISAIANKARAVISIQLKKHGFYHRSSFFGPECFFEIIMRYEYLRLMEFKGKHKGKRCFIIGNGPSLTPEDLDKIKDEYSFAANSIFDILSKTQWHPSYYVVIDERILMQKHKVIQDTMKCPVFYDAYRALSVDEFAITDGYFFTLDGRVGFQPMPYTHVCFSEEPVILFNGSSVAYCCMQLAAYMGFSEIYLLGVDYSFPVAIGLDGRIIRSDVDMHFPSYKDGEVNHYQIDIIEAGYKAAKEYCDSHGIKIRNATRGGKLEIFERVDFDRLF